MSDRKRLTEQQIGDVRWLIERENIEALGFISMSAWNAIKFLLDEHESMIKTHVIEL
jgi:hypothetical protein